MPYQHFIHVPTLWRSLKQPQNLSIFLAIGCLWTTWPTNQFVELVFWTICAHRKTWQVLRRSSSGQWKQKSTFILSCFLKKYVSDPSGVEVKEREPEKEEGTPILHMSNWYCGGQKKRSKETHAHWLTGVTDVGSIYFMHTKKRCVFVRILLRFPHKEDASHWKKGLRAGWDQKTFHSVWALLPHVSVLAAGAAPWANVIP